MANTGESLKITEVQNRSPQLVDTLLDVWERSVRATHLFLTSEQIAAIKEYVPQALENVEHLIVATKGPASADTDEPVAFMGLEDDRLEMLFIAPEERGRGLGKRLLQLGIERYKICELTVNEQNPQAVGFYEHMGFTTYKRTDLDEEGNPYPLLYMRLK